MDYPHQASNWVCPWDTEDRAIWRLMKAAPKSQFAAQRKAVLLSDWTTPEELTVQL